MKMRVRWGVVFYILALACLAVMTWKYGLVAGLLAFVAAELMTASMLLIFITEGAETDE